MTGFRVLPISRRCGHLLVEWQGVLSVVDTGSSRTIPAPSILRDRLGGDVRQILGTDELGRSPFELDLVDDRLRIQADPAPMGCAGTVSPIRMVSGVPMVEVAWKYGRSEWAVLDTGAWLSYGPEEVVTRGTFQADGVEDFHPEVGIWTTGTWMIHPFVLGQYPSITAGLLPDRLQRLLFQFDGARWIIGREALDGRRYRIDLAAGTITEYPDLPTRLSLGCRITNLEYRPAREPPATPWFGCHTPRRRS